MSTCEQQLDQFWKFFDRVSLLSGRNGGRVWRVRHRKTGQDCILRQLDRPNDVYLTLCAFRCPHLPTVYDVYHCEDGMIVLEEYISGLTVAQVAETGRYRQNGAKKVLAGVCGAMMVLHQNGIVHRDIKPENVIVDADGRVVLIDFNAARRISRKSRDTEVMGTVGYASPEQLGLKESDERTDIYAAGVLLNVLLTGQYPTDTLARGRYGRIVRKCTNINPNERYPSAEKLYKAL